MFTQPFHHIFTPKNLTGTFLSLDTKSSGIDNVSLQTFKQNLQANIGQLHDELLSGSYTPEPLKKIEIQKDGRDESRPIGLSAIRDKIVQRRLNQALNPHFNASFSDKSYAYRPNKNTLKAINRCNMFINQKNFWIFKSDIDNFFENIPHDRLLTLLDNEIQDKKIIRLISLLLQNGGFKQERYIDNIEGIHQGDSLSPLLSNIYLDQMDKFLEKRQMNFVRFGDDFTIFCANEKQAQTIQTDLTALLKEIGLSLGENKTYIAHIKQGFTFLGIQFKGYERSIENERLQKSIAKILKYAKKHKTFEVYIKKLNNYIKMLSKYYLKIIKPDSKQFELLQNAIDESIAHKIYYAKKSQEITTKSRFKELIETIDFIQEMDETQKRDKIELLIGRGYEQYLATKSYKEEKTKLNKKKSDYSKKFATDATIHISEFGLFLGISKNKYVIKKYGKVQKSIPQNIVKRIVIDSKGVLLSSDVIQKCAKANIPIDFIDYKSNPYASLVTFSASLAQNTHKQIALLNTPAQLTLAKAFAKGKAKNQINYLKYLDKYHKELESEIEQMENSLKKMQKTAKTSNEIMGYEGEISSRYWQSIGKILDERIEFSGRETQGAKDIFNSSLNYGYAILYGKVQHYLVQAGLSLHISFLHSLNGNKPTLVYDLIEEFRTFVVDRTIISMINKKEPLKLDKEGWLTKKSRHAIAKNLYEKFGSYTNWKKEHRKVENIIEDQAYKLAQAINEAGSYKPFIGKF